jgi:putative transposase
LSDESSVEPLNSFKKHQQRLAKYQRRKSRKVKFSSSWKKAKARIQKIQTGIANARREFLHKFTTTISKNRAIVAIEDLQVRNNVQVGGRHKRSTGQKRLGQAGAEHVHPQSGLGRFGRQMEYKMAWTSGYLVAVPRHHTSQTRPCCSHVAKENRFTQTKFL